MGAVTLRRIVASIPSAAPASVRPSPWLLLQQPISGPFLRSSLCWRNFCTTTANSEAMRADMFMDEVRYKCKTGGLRNLDQALSWFHGMIRLRPLPLAADFALLLGGRGQGRWLAIPTPPLRSHASTEDAGDHGDRVGAANLRPRPRIDLDLELEIQVDSGIRTSNRRPDLTLHGRLHPRGFGRPLWVSATLVARPLWPSGLLEKWEGRSSSRVNVVTYNTVVMGLCKEGQLAEAFKLFKKMMDKGVEPTVVTYDTLIHAVCSAGHWEEVEALLKGMIQGDIVPDV
ncbi:hypothetical protein CRG98_031007 [Punica granatum]|uniref:Pentatricopeptide repeat-containing protein n=1 Tax=Punica granatum TaxID=22663 RepID=A0A2I0IX66_PUNGR|nr:hypothetical protein CRG98_031007 [Punica granatum]